MVSKHYENLLKRVDKLEKIYLENVKVSNLCTLLHKRRFHLDGTKL